jgi:hypothetical protein
MGSRKSRLEKKRTTAQADGYDAPFLRLQLRIFQQKCSPLPQELHNMKQFHVKCGF